MDEITQAARAWFRYAELPSEYGDAIVAAYVMGYTAGLERAAKAASEFPASPGQAAVLRGFIVAAIRTLAHPLKEAGDAG